MKNIWTAATPLENDDAVRNWLQENAPSDTYLVSANHTERLYEGYTVVICDPLLVDCSSEEKYDAFRAVFPEPKTRWYREGKVQLG